MSRIREQGNVLVFVIIGILLTAALIGAVVIVRHLQTSTPAPTPTPSGTTGQAASDSKDTASTDAADKQTNDQALKDALAAQAAKDKKNATASQPAPAKTTTSSASTGSSSTSTTTTASNLPQTGPESALVTIVGASLLVGMTFAYTRSRRLI